MHPLHRLPRAAALAVERGLGAALRDTATTRPRQGGLIKPPKACPRPPPERAKPESRESDTACRGVPNVAVVLTALGVSVLHPSTACAICRRDLLPLALVLPRRRSRASVVREGIWPVYVQTRVKYSTVNRPCARRRASSK